MAPFAAPMFYPQQGASNTRYRRSFIISGLITLITVPLNVVPFSPFVSSTALLTQTGDTSCRPFIIGCLCCLLVGLFTPLTHFLPPYLYRSAVRSCWSLTCRCYIPVYLSVSKLPLPREISIGWLCRYLSAFFDGATAGLSQTLPLTIRPLLGNGLLIGVLLAVAMENLIPWDRIKS